jgi:hypothetical protein
LRQPEINAQIRGVRGHEAAQGGRIEAGAEIIQAGFGVAFFGGEFVGGGGAAKNLFAEGEIVEIVDDGLVEGGDQASGP